MRRVLIVEDDDGIREALAECVASMGVEVATARDGQDGLSVARAGSRPDAILLDLRMPRLDGHGFLSAVRADPALAGIPVIAMTAWHDQPRLPVYAFLKKPFDLDELAKILGRLARPRQRPSEPAFGRRDGPEPRWRVPTGPTAHPCSRSTRCDKTPRERRPAWISRLGFVS